MRRLRAPAEHCTAAETLTTWGARKRSARYVGNPEKIIRVGNAYVGLVGWWVTQSVMKSAFGNGCPLPEVRDELELFEYSRALHRKLKSEYYLNSLADAELPYESSQMTAFVMNRYGLFSMDPLRGVDRCARFAAAGSGADFALGAMYAAYDSGLPVEDVARLGIEAGIEFDDASLGPITLKKMKLEA